MSSSPEPTARGWTGVAEAYAASFALLCAGIVPAVLAAADPRPGTRLLDVGAGTGELAGAAARLGASVTAVEPDPRMRALAERTLAGRGVDVRDGALPHLPLDPAFDVVVAAFVVNHVDDPRAAARELARLTAPGGRVVVTGWPSGRTVQARLFADVLAAAGATPPPDERLAADRDFARTPEGYAGLLHQAGLSEVTATTYDWVWRVDPADLWAGVRAGVGGIGRAYAHQSGEVRTRLDTAYDERSAPLLDAGTLVLPTTGIVVTGRAATR